MLYGVFGIVIVCLFLCRPSFVTDVLWLTVRASAKKLHE